ncbi:MAG TPA: hypothetical protein PLE42_01835 [Candidatus Competibacteraceae bacterium]|nr:MAG: hypothetical protein EKK69_08080 [Candidatus Competibacteraceae bacterium]HNW78467.1 hypothetical protein [Candidatus Competibacteraceae bacterium]HQC71440.1 hypothetical protein [Candidatus Competibacteraceae bacterium]
MGMTLWIQTLDDRDYAQDSDDYSLLYRYTEPLDALCATLGMAPLSSFFDDSDLLFNFSESDDDEDEDARELDPETGLGYGIDDMAWFDAAAGLATLCALRQHLATVALPDIPVDDQADLLEELDSGIQRLEAATQRKARFHLALIE